jgi:PilZ domain
VPIDSEIPRAHPRYAVEIDAEVTAGDTRVPVRTRDVSRGGLAFVSTMALPAGSEVGLSMSLVFSESSFSEPLRVRARVVWSTELGPGRHQIGTAFTNFTGEQRSNLDLFLRFLREGMSRTTAPPPGETT